MHHSRSSPDLAVKQGAAGAGVDVHRHHSEDGGLHVPRHHSLMLPPGDPSIAHRECPCCSLWCASHGKGATPLASLPALMPACVDALRVVT